MRQSEEGRCVAAEVIPEFISAEVLCAPEQCVTATQQKQKRAFLREHDCISHDFIPRVLIFLSSFFPFFDATLSLLEVLTAFSN